MYIIQFSKIFSGSFSAALSSGNSALPNVYHNFSDKVGQLFRSLLNRITSDQLIFARQKWAVPNRQLYEENKSLYLNLYKGQQDNDQGREDNDQGRGGNCPHCLCEGSVLITQNLTLTFEERLYSFMIS